jgi:hypothetical protein
MLGYRVRRVKSLASVLSHLKPLREHFGDWRAMDISFRAIEEYITTRRDDEKSNADHQQGARAASSGPPSRPRPSAAAFHPEGPSDPLPDSGPVRVTESGRAPG